MKSIKDMAHDYMCNLILKGFPLNEIDTMAERCFKLAEAMHAEAEKRKVKKDTVSLTKDGNGNCLHLNHEFGHKKCMDCGDSLEQWQPDWSQAPDTAIAWEMRYGSNDEARWLHDHDKAGFSYSVAPTFNYQGDWKDSLRRRL